MKKLWFITIVMLIFILLPSGYAVSSTVDDIQPIEIAQIAEHLPRIYDTNVAREIYSDINYTRFKEIVQEFTANGSRYFMTYADISGSTNEDSRNWLVQEMTMLSNGRLNISIEGTFMNIVATLPGFLPGDDLPIFVLSAHYDSADDSPGANTDGSGIAVMLELVRVMSKYEWPLDIVFMIFNGEHALGGNLGSKELSNQYAVSGVEILAMYNVDTILIQNRWDDPDKRIVLSYNLGAQYWANLAKVVGCFYGGNIVTLLPSYEFTRWPSSSQYNFAEKGFQNVLLVYESGYMNDDISGTESDVWSRGEFNYYLCREVTAFIGESLAFTMSRGYGHKAQLFDTRNIRSDSSYDFYIPISTETTINVTSRWFGGAAHFTLYDPDDSMINTSIHTEASPWEPTQVMNPTVTTPGLYKLHIHNPEETSIGVDIYIEYDSDIDQNGVLDSEEYWLDSELFETDADNDTISDAMEIILGLDLNSPDGDNDDMPDAWELSIGLDPRNPLDAFNDPDLDNLTNLQEYNLGLNPFSDDSDFDGMIDSWELANGLNPLVNDAYEDPDEDEYTNIEEYLRGSDPQVAEVTEPLNLQWFVIPSTAVVLIGAAMYLVRRKQRV
ncbi:MAG: M28 family peptidase [Candidatus Thorarchaeota archaeon]